MILVDTSVWIDFLRDIDSRASEELSRLARRPKALATTEPIVMELLAGAPDDTAWERIDRLTSRLTLMTIAPQFDFRAAAQIYRAARVRGLTVRTLTDCLIGAVAIRCKARLVHKNRDFAAIAACTALDAVDLR